MFPRPCFVSGARRPHLDRFHIERIQKARLYTDRTFHSLVSLQRLATWGLGPIPSPEALAHDITTRRCKLLSFIISLFYLLYIYIYIYIFKLTSFLLGMTTMKENKGKEVVDEGVKSQPRPPTGEKRKKSHRGWTWVTSQADEEGIRSTSLPNLKASNLLLPLPWSPLYRFLL